VSILAANFLKNLIRPICAGIMFYVLARISLNSAAEIEGIIMIWPASGFCWRH
jgi:hypothetical protein